MNSFDTLTLKLYNIPEEAITLAEYYTCNEGKTIYKVKGLHHRPGLTEVTYDTRQRTLKITISSKLLVHDCFRLVNVNTLPTLYGILDGLGLFIINWEAFCAAEVLRADVTADVRCTAISEALTSLEAHASGLYGVTEVHKARNGQKTSLTFEKNRQSKVNQIRLQCYDKLDALKKDNDFLAYFTSQQEYHNILDQARDILRLETNFANFQKMYKYFDIPTNTLKNLIYSKTNVLFKIMQEIIYAAPISDSSGPIDPMQLDPKELPVYATLKLFDFDLPALRSYYKAKCARNAARQAKPFEELYARIQPSNPGPAKAILKYLEFSY